MYSLAVNGVVSDSYRTREASLTITVRFLLLSSPCHLKVSKTIRTRAGTQVAAGAGR